MARLLAITTGAVVIGAVFAFAAVQQEGAVLRAGPAASPFLDQVPDTIRPLVARGREVYGEQACAACHSIAGTGSPRFPLDGVGSRLTAEEIRLWIEDPQAMRPGVRKPAYDDLEEEALRSLIAFMESLEEP